jgi:squalene-associated FAD-dependent desaturase
VAIIGGGLAGQAAALAAAERGLRVRLFEQGKTLGGRAASLLDAETGTLIDVGQHVAMGCCTEWIDFCRRLGEDDCFERYHQLHFFDADGRQFNFAPSDRLPVPLHAVPALFRLGFLSLGDRWRILRAAFQLARSRFHSGSSGDGTIGAWLKRHGQSERAIARFWSPIFVSALGETVDHASRIAARHVLTQGFLASREASDLLVPRRPLQSLFHDQSLRRLTELGVAVHLNAKALRVEGDADRAHRIAFINGAASEDFDAVIVAVPWRSIRPLLSNALFDAVPALEGLDEIEPGTIATVHLWFDRPITPLPHAALVDRLSQWVFASLEQDKANPRQHVQVVISAAHRLVDYDNETLKERVLDELHTLWPTVHAAKLLHARVVSYPAAVFSLQPGVEPLRPPQNTPVTNLFLAGDWTSTGWPATMEGAVSSGQRAVELLCESSL